MFGRVLSAFQFHQACLLWVSSSGGVVVNAFIYLVVNGPTCASSPSPWNSLGNETLILIPPWFHDPTNSYLSYSTYN